MIKRFGSGYFAITVEISRPTYTKTRTLERSEEEDFEIIKRETKPPATEWICYSYLSGGEEIAFVRGYFVTKDRFHIQRVKNLLRDKKEGYKCVPKLLRVLEEDMRAEGAKQITTASIYKLAPIAMKRFGFSSINGQTYKQVKASWLRWIPRLWKPLKKELT